MLAWWTAQIQSQIRLHVGSATLDPIPRLAAQLQLGSAQLSSARGRWHGRWVLQWWRVSWCGMPTVHADVTIMLWWRHCYPGQSRGSGRVSPLGKEDAWGASARVDSHLTGACKRLRLCPTSDFDAVFTSGVISSSFTQWYGQNIILTTFIFGQKSNTTLNHMLWYQLLGIPTPMCGPVMYW
jgi:hypothetical protein